MENVERYQSLSKKRLLYKSYYVISIGSRWGELCSFSLTSKGSVSWANILSHFHRASLTLAAPHRHTWQWQMRQCVEEWGGGGGRVEGGGGGSPREGWLPPPGESLTHWPRLVASQCWPPLAQGQPLCVHIFTPGQIATQARKSSPPIPTSLPAHLLLPPPSPSKNILSGTPSAAFWPPVLLFFFLSLSLPLAHFLLPSAGCVHIFCVPYTGLSKHYLLYYGCTWPIYTWFSFHNILYIWLMWALEKQKTNKQKKNK